MAHITQSDAQAWLETTKLSLDDLDGIDPALEVQISAMILARLRKTFDITAWEDATSTPDLVRALIAMYYVAAVYDRTYSDDTDDTTSNYAWVLRRQADNNIKGLVEGDLFLPDPDTGNQSSGQPIFYPNDASSLGLNYAEDKSETPAAFSMGQVF